MSTIYDYMTRVCNNCNIDKEVTDFRGNCIKCKKCEYQAHKQYCAEYWKRNKEKRRAIVNRSKKKNITKRREWARDYRIKNKDRINALNKESKQRNVERVRKTAKIYKLVNRERVNKYMNEYFRRRNDSDELFRLSASMRKRTCAAFKNSRYKKNGTTEVLLGAPFSVVKEHIENLFTQGMSIEKVGMQIHIDHVIPLSSAKTEQELIALCHYTNLQPLWALDNIRKGAKIIVK